MTETKLIRFPVTYQNEAVQQPLIFGDGDTVFNDIQLSEVSQCLALNVTSEQYKLLLSAAINGANRHFPENWIEIIYPLISAGKNYCEGTMSCEDVADCIETDVGVQDAIDNQILTSNDQTGLINPDSLTPSGTESTTIIIDRMTQETLDSEPKELVDCNLDELWAGIYFMVEQLDSVGRDWLEQAVASGDKWQRAASIAKNIPIIGSLASTALEQLAEVAQDLLNLYNGYSTEVALQEIACDLFEMTCSLCRYPTFDEIQTYYAQNSTITGGNLAEISLKAMVDFLIGSSLAISQLAYHTIISMVLFTLYIGSEFVGLRGARWIPIWLDNGEEYANDAWIILCDGCADENWAYTLDLTTALPAWVSVELGTWTNGVGVEAVDGGSPTVSGVNVLLTLDESYSMKRVSVEYERSSDGSVNDDLRIIGYTNYPSSTGRENWIEVDEPAHTNENRFYCNAAPGTPSGAKIQWLFVLRDNNPGTPMIMKSIKFWNDAYNNPPNPLPDNSEQFCLE